MKLKDLLSRRIDDHEMERLRKYKLAVRVSIAAFCSMTVFIVKDIIEGDMCEMLSEVVVCAIIVAAFAFLRKHKNDLIVYRVALILISLSFLYAAWIGSGNGAVLYWLFFVPLTFIYFLGEYEGIFWISVFGLLLAVLIFNPLGLPIYVYDFSECVIFFGSFIFGVAIIYLIEHNRSVYATKLVEQKAVLGEEKIKAEKALYEIKVLQGLLPICSYCKKIRGDKGYWHDVAVYIQNHSAAEFTHSICPDCEKELVEKMGTDGDTE